MPRNDGHCLSVKMPCQTVKQRKSSNRLGADPVVRRILKRPYISRGHRDICKFKLTDDQLQKTRALLPPFDECHLMLRKSGSEQNSRQAHARTDIQNAVGRGEVWGEKLGIDLRLEQLRIQLGNRPRRHQVERGVITDDKRFVQLEFIQTSPNHRCFT